MALSIYNIPSSRVCDSSFWALLFRMQVYPSKRNTAKRLYTQLLPALNNTPLRANLDPSGGSTKSEFHPPPDPRASRSYHHLALLAFSTDAAPGTASAEFEQLNLRHLAMNQARKDVEVHSAGTLEAEDAKVRISLLHFCRSFLSFFLVFLSCLSFCLSFFVMHSTLDFVNVLFRSVSLCSALL